MTSPLAMRRASSIQTTPFKETKLLFSLSRNLDHDSPGRRARRTARIVWPSAGSGAVNDWPNSSGSKAGSAGNGNRWSASGLADEARWGARRGPDFGLPATPLAREGRLGFRLVMRRKLPTFVAELIKQSLLS